MDGELLNQLKIGLLVIAVSCAPSLILRYTFGVRFIFRKNRFKPVWVAGLVFGWLFFVGYSVGRPPFPIPDPHFNAVIKTIVGAISGVLSVWILLPPDWKKQEM